MPTKITIDFETRSEVELGGKSKQGVGAWAYSQHPTTEVLCTAYKVGETLPCLWINPTFRNNLPYFPDYTVTEECPVYFREPFALFEAHNAPFERAIWENIMVPKFGWPSIPLRQWRCSAAKCSASALPRNLDQACKALGLPIQKDNKGHNLMMKMCKPRKPKKAEKINWWLEPEQLRNCSHEVRNELKARILCSIKADFAASEMPTLWHEKPQQLLDLFNYCIQDVEAAHCLSQAVRDLDPTEQEAWFLDQEINERGFMIDMETVNATLELLEERKASLLEEVAVLTNGHVLSPQQTAESLKWLAGHGLELPNMQAETVKQALADLVF